MDYLRLDSDAVFKSADWREILGQYTVTAGYSNPYTPTENGLQERTWGMVIPAAPAMLRTTGLPKSYWDYAAGTTVYLHNRTPHAGVGGIPLQLLTRTPVKLGHLVTFGCPAYVHIPGHQRRKLDDKAFEGIMVGYSTDSPSYII